MSTATTKPTSYKILLGVTGGIAAYKSADLVRRLKENGFEVRVVMTSGAQEFITPMTLQAVSGNPVNDRLFDREAEAAMGHIELAKWADIILIAPATANSIAKLAAGFADDLLTTLVLASKARLVIAPAMNQQMWANSTTKFNAELLAKRGTIILGPASGEQACGDIGAGRMVEPFAIAEKLVSLTQSGEVFLDNALNPNSLNRVLQDKKLVITAGPTVEPIDPVRYISNHSSGKMGYALAQAAVDAGAKVTLVSGPVDLGPPEGLELCSVRTASDMLNVVKQKIQNCDVFIGCAAVADYTPAIVKQQKIKKNDQEMQLKLVKNPDIIAWVAKQQKRPFVVGFAAESQNLEEFATAKLEKKGLDLICANDISEQNLGFNSDNNKILMLGKDGTQRKLGIATKNAIAQDIILQISKNLVN